MGKILGAFFLGLALILSCGNAFSATVDVEYDYSGVPGNYLLDFTVTNNIDASYGQNLYFFGVDLAYSSSQGSPSGWGYWGNTWDNQYYGGSDRDYPSTWITWNDSYSLKSGNSLSGFTVPVSVIPETIHYYAYLLGSVDYYGDDAFFKGKNPGFEGVVNGNVVPEPVSSLLFGIGGAAMALARKKKKTA